MWMSSLVFDSASYGFLKNHLALLPPWEPSCCFSPISYRELSNFKRVVSASWQIAPGLIISVFSVAWPTKSPPFYVTLQVSFGPDLCLLPPPKRCGRLWICVGICLCQWCACSSSHLFLMSLRQWTSGVFQNTLPTAAGRGDLAQLRDILKNLKSVFCTHKHAG